MDGRIVRALKQKKTLLPGSVPTVQPQCHAVGDQLKRSGSAQAHPPETQHKAKRSRASAKLEIAWVRKNTLHDTSLALCSNEMIINNYLSVNIKNYTDICSRFGDTDIDIHLGKTLLIRRCTF